MTKTAWFLSLDIKVAERVRFMIVLVTDHS